MRHPTFPKKVFTFIDVILFYFYKIRHWNGKIHTGLIMCQENLLVSDVSRFGVKYSFNPLKFDKIWFWSPKIVFFFVLPKNIKTVFLVLVKRLMWDEKQLFLLNVGANMNKTSTRWNSKLTNFTEIENILNLFLIFQFFIN